MWLAILFMYVHLFEISCIFSSDEYSLIFKYIFLNALLFVWKIDGNILQYIRMHSTRVIIDHYFYKARPRLVLPPFLKWLTILHTSIFAILYILLKAKLTLYYHFGTTYKPVIFGVNNEKTKPEIARSGPWFFLMDSNVYNRSFI